MIIDRLDLVKISWFVVWNESAWGFPGSSIHWYWSMRWRFSVFSSQKNSNCTTFVCNFRIYCRVTSMRNYGFLKVNCFTCNPQAWPPVESDSQSPTNPMIEHPTYPIFRFLVFPLNHVDLRATWFRWGGSDHTGKPQIYLWEVNSLFVTVSTWFPYKCSGHDWLFMAEWLHPHYHSAVSC